MADSRTARRAQRRARVQQAAVGASQVDPALDALELMELAWHDCYGESTPPDEVVENVLILRRGRLDHLVSAVLLGITDRRDLRVSADNLRA